MVKVFRSFLVFLALLGIIYFFLVAFGSLEQLNYYTDRHVLMAETLFPTMLNRNMVYFLPLTIILTCLVFILKKRSFIALIITGVLSVCILSIVPSVLPKEEEFSDSFSQQTSENFFIDTGDTGYCVNLEQGGSIIVQPENENSISYTPYQQKKMITPEHMDQKTVKDPFNIRSINSSAVLQYDYNQFFSYWKKLNEQISGRGLIINASFILFFLSLAGVQQLTHWKLFNFFLSLFLLRLFLFQFRLAQIINTHSILSFMIFPGIILFLSICFILIGILKNPSHDGTGKGDTI